MNIIHYDNLRVTYSKILPRKEGKLEKFENYCAVSYSTLVGQGLKTEHIKDALYDMEVASLNLSKLEKVLMGA